jgi:hypothetical protein
MRTEQGGTEPRGTPERTVPLTTSKERAPGVQAHRQEAIEFYRTFPNQRVGNRP